MKSKILSKLFVTLLAVIMLTGCGAQSTNEYKVINPGKQKAGSSEEKKQKNTLTVWCWDSFNINAMEKAEEDYKKTHPDFELNIVDTPWADVQTKVKTAVLAANTETLPDIVLMQDGAFQKNVLSYPDGFADLTDSGIDFSKFSAGKVSFSTVAGKNYGVPFDNGAVIACYRSDILEEAGFTVEDFQDITWDEYIKKGKVVLEKTGKPLLSCVSGESDVIVMMLQSAGGGFFDAEGNVTIADNAILEEVMDTYARMVEEGVLLEVNDWDQYIGSINDSTVAGTINGCWIMASIQAAEDQSGQWAVTNMPRLSKAETATNYANQGGSSWAITSGCQNVELAADFLGSTYGGSVSFYENILDSGAIACYLPAGESPMYGEKNAYFSNDAVYTKIIDYAGKIPACTTGVYYYEARDAVAIAIKNITAGSDIDSELAAAQQKVQSEIE